MEAPVAMSSTRRPGGRRAAVFATAAAALAVLCDAAYLAVIASQGDPGVGRPVVVFVACYAIALATAALAGGFATKPFRRLALLSWGAAGSYALGLLGAFSLVMLPLIASGILLTLAATRSDGRNRSTRRTRLVIVMAVLAVGPLLLGVFGLQSS